jgi:hypothetical protein
MRAADSLALAGLAAAALLTVSSFFKTPKHKLSFRCRPGALTGRAA